MRESDHGDPIRGVSVSELNRHTCDVVRQVEGGERVIVTNHGRPVAVLLPVADGVDVLLAHLAMEAPPAPNEDSHRSEVLTVELTAEASNQLTQLPRARQVMLRTELRRAAVNRAGQGPLVVRTPQDLAGCVALTDRDTLLVYAVLPRWKATKRLLGPALFEAWRARNSARLSHGRPAVRY